MKWIRYSLPVVLALVAIFFTASKPAALKEAVPQNERPGPVALKWVLNKEKSNVTFSLQHLVVSTAEGAFKTFDGTMEAAKADFSDAKINFTIDAASVDTDNEERDRHLKSDDYFDVAKYPKMTFESISFKPGRSKKYQLTGNMTIKDIKKTVVFDVIYEGSAGAKGAVATFKCTAVINRYDFNVKAGGAALGKDVTIKVNVQMDEVK